LWHRRHLRPDNVAGGECDTDADCISGEECRDGTCGILGGAGDDCATAEECNLPLVCAPSGDVCTEPADTSCTDNSDCGNAAFCDADGECAVATDETPCTDDSDCTASSRCLGVVCIPDECQGEAFEAEVVPANVMIVLDRSGSMDWDIDGTPKWDIARDAVYDIVANSSGQIRWGLNLFPGYDQACDEGQQCGVGVTVVDIGDNTAGGITNYLQDTGTCLFGTPIAEDMTMLLDYTPLQDQDRDNYILLITDGEANCDDPVPVVELFADRNPPTPTFVVGFGSGVDPQQLEDMAEAGGTALPGNPAYYQADNAAGLQQALDDIVGEVLSCDYDIPTAPSDPDRLSVYFDGVRVPRDPSGTTGWEYSPANARLSFAGNACVALQSGSVQDLTIVYGCPLAEEPPDAGPPDPPPDAGNPPPDAGTPPGECNDRCEHGCGEEACLLPQGECGPCQDNSDCCPGYVCITDNGTCIDIGG
jgi:hypothetical protein